jgi:hypothetical protein
MEIGLNIIGKLEIFRKISKKLLKACRKQFFRELIGGFAKANIVEIFPKNLQSS